MIGAIFSNLNAALNVALGLVLGVVSLWLVYHNHDGLRWLSLLESLVGLYYAAVYIFVLTADPKDYNPVLFGQLFIRPAMSMVLGTMAAGAIVRLRLRRNGS